MSDTVIVHLQVAGRSLPLEVPQEDQELVQNAAALLEKKLNSLSGSSMNPESRLVMAALDLAGNCLKAEQAAERQQVQTELALDAEKAQIPLTVQQHLEMLLNELGRAMQADPPDTDRY